VLTKFAAYAHLSEGQFLHAESTRNTQNFLSFRESSLRPKVTMRGENKFR